MNIGSKKIVSFDEVCQDTREVFSRTEVEDSIVVFVNNKPKYVMLSIEEYHELMNNSKVGIAKNDTSENYVTDMLNAIGKKVFVEYYFIFINLDKSFTNLIFRFITQTIK